MRVNELILCLVMSTMTSCKSYWFSKVANYSETEVLQSNVEGFVGIDEECYYGGQTFERFLCFEDSVAVFDGYFNVHNMDTLFFIPYHTVVQGCPKKLVFYIPSATESYWLGKSCQPLELWALESTVLVQNISCSESLCRFSHSIVGTGDYLNSDEDAIVSIRYFEVSRSKGITINLTTSEPDADVYWFNY